MPKTPGRKTLKDEIGILQRYSDLTQSYFNVIRDHLDSERTIYIYRVKNLDRAVVALKKRGLKKESRLEIPMGPCSSFVTPGGQRIALYEAARPGVLQHFLGRKDF